MASEVESAAREWREANEHRMHHLARGNLRSVLDEIVGYDEGRHFSLQLPGVVRELSVISGGIVYAEWGGAAFSFPPKIQARSIRMCKAKNVGDVTAGVEDVSGTHGGATRKKRSIPRNSDGAFLSRDSLQP